jgi:hypothetical protein
VVSKSTLFVATAIAAGLVSAARGLPGSTHPESTRHTAAERPAVAAPAAHRFGSCTDLRRTWPHGVGWAPAHDASHGTPVTNFHHSKKIYAANASLDRDGDHIACEAH